MSVKLDRQSDPQLPLYERANHQSLYLTNDFDFLNNISTIINYLHVINLDINLDDSGKCLIVPSTQQVSIVANYPPLVEC